MAEPVNIDLSWDIDIRFGDLRKDVMLQKQVSLSIILATHFCVFLLHIFVCSPFILCSPDACISLVHVSSI